jgi:quinol-cytochrome oxidoreductase complex cytochrome b subunit
LEQPLLLEIIQSIFPQPLRSEAGTRTKRYLLRNLALHFRPTSVPRQTLRFSLTWGLGGMAATLIMLQLASGVLLTFAYVPTPVAAYGSIQAIITDMPFGRLIRNLHHWCAHLLVAVALLHMLRVFFTGAFHPPRQFNWVVGLGLVATVLLANFTGYLLPWDQLAFWAVTVSTGMLEYLPIIGAPVLAAIREGTEIGSATLQVFFALHTAVIPAALLGVMAFHFWRVRKAGGLVVPRPAHAPADGSDGKADRVATVPHLVLRELVTALVVIAVVLLISLGIDAPLADPANPGLSPNPTRAPWYFAGLQELLLHFHPLVAVCLIPLVAAGTLLAIPYLKYDADTAGVWFASRIGRRTGLVGALVGLTLTPLLVVVREKVVAPSGLADRLSPMVVDGMAPTALLMAVFGLFYWLVRKKMLANRNEAVQALFILLLAAFGVLTAIGVWFRGEGMALVLPW